MLRGVALSFFLLAFLSGTAVAERGSRFPRVTPVPVASDLQPPPPPPDLPGDETTVNELTVDLRKGAPTSKPEGDLTRLQAVVYAINSINTTTKDLLTVDDLLKAAFRDGKIPATGEAKVKIDLRKFLTAAQIGRLTRLLQDDPFSCNGERDLTAGVRADSILKNIFDPQNYNDLIGLTDNRRDFERTLGLGREFDGDEQDRDRTRNTKRLIIAPGDSGIVHDDTYRKIVLQRQQARGREGLLVARSEDTEKHNAAKRDHNFAERPVAAKGDAHEEIWELPNGMRGYALRLRSGALQKAAPPTLVKEKITNPLTCMRCHDTGFIATTGEGGAKAHPDLTKIDLNLNESGFPRGLAKDQYAATPREYNGAIAVANQRLATAIADSGAMTPREFQRYFLTLGAGYRLDELANELGVEPSRISEVLAGDRSFKNIVNPTAIAESLKEFAKTKDPKALEVLSRTQLEREVRIGRNSLSLYCVLKQRLVGIEEARLHTRPGRTLGREPAATHDRKI